VVNFCARLTAAVLALAIAIRAEIRAEAQVPPRVQFPQPAPSTPAAPPAPPGLLNTAPGYAAPPYGAPAYGSVAPPASSGGIFSVPPGATAVPYGAPPAYGAPPVVAAPPGYYPPGYYAPDPRFAQGPSSIFPPSNYSNPYPNGQQYYGNSQGGVSEYTKFIQGISFEHTWLAGDDGTDLDQNDSDIAVTFALPVFPNPKNPLYISPGFGLHLWAGPQQPESGSADLPANAYDAYIDATWRPQFSEAFGMELAIRPGIYTTFDSVNAQSIRIQGRGLAFIRMSPTWQVAIGAVYLDRLDIKLLPAGGLIWTPSEKARYEILFPKPKLAHYLYTSGMNTEWWIYATGEYGGGSWTIDRVGGFDDQIDINDIRVSIGLEFKPTQAIDASAAGGRRNYVGYFEAGYVFEREILYRSKSPPEFNLPETFMLRAGLRF
jgi:hypothetical protein